MIDLLHRRRACIATIHAYIEHKDSAHAWLVYLSCLANREIFDRIRETRLQAAVMHALDRVNAQERIRFLQWEASRHSRQARALVELLIYYGDRYPAADRAAIANEAGCLQRLAAGMAYSAHELLRVVDALMEDV